MSSHGSDSDDEGFAPFIPGLTTTTAAPQPQPQPTSSCDVVETAEGHIADTSTEPSPGTKRPRESSVDIHTPPASSPCAPDSNNHTETCQAVTSAITAAEEKRAAAWERYVRLGLPSASLYYRSFLHTSEPTPLPDHADGDENDYANAGHDGDTTTHEEKKDVKQLATAEGLTPGSPTSFLVDDMLTIQDSIGLLVCSIDERGVLRLWRKLPRGIFFWGELDRIFGTPTATAATAHGEREGDDGAHAAVCRYYLRSSADLSSLVCVRVQELRDSPLTEQPESTGSGATTTAAAVVDVLVEVRVVNPYTLTVEGRHACAFAAPLRDGQPCYTPQPSLLLHKYELYLALFTALAPSSTEGSASGARDEAASTLAQGVVVIPCQADKSTMRSPHEPSAMATAALASPLNSAVQYVLAAPLSVASRVVACVQPGAASRAHQEQHKAPLPCVLLGAGGMIDYAVMENTPVNDSDEAGESAGVSMRSSGNLYRRNGLGLRVLGGLATCPPRSAEHRLWSQMITFKRRSNTDFFALLKLARASTEASLSAHATPGLTATHGAALKAIVMPFACSFVPNGGEFVIASACVSLRSHNLANTAATELAVYVQNCLHWVDFASGKLRGSYVAPLDAMDGVEVIPMHLPSTTQLSNVMDAWSAFVDTLMACGGAGAGCCPMVGMHVLPSACPAVPGGFEYHVLVPEISPAELLPGLVASSRMTHSGSSRSRQQAGVPGRLVRVYRAALAEANTSSASPASSLTIEPLSHAVGESERVVRRGALPTPAHHASNTSSGDYTALLLAATSDANVTRHAHASVAHAHFPTTPRGSAMVPLLLLASNVEPSQSLKNFISQSPVGASLSADEVKQLLVVPSRSEAHRHTEAPTTSYTDPLLCTTALGPSAASALLLFSATPAETNPATAAAAQWLKKILATPHGTQDEAEVVTVQGTASGDTCGNATPSQAHVKTAVDLLVQQRVWNSLTQELAQRRQFACGDLLAGTTVSHPAASTPHADGAVAENEANDAHHLEPGTGAEEAKTTRASDVTTPGSGANGAPAAALDEKSQVLALLAPVLAALPPSPPTASSPYVPKEHGLVHVRGYGTIRLAFLPRMAPLAVENFQRLARQGYYNALTFHRVIPLTIVQGGCPLGDGTGGRCVFPGQETFPDENLDAFPFFSHTEHAWLCMANAGRNTNGSQFFFTVPNGQEMPWLNGQHTVFGFVVGGASLLTAMSEVPRDEDDKPRIPIVMERIDIY